MTGGHIDAAEGRGADSSIDAAYAVPADFPTSPMISTVPGAQSKFSSVLFDGHFYAPGSTPPEIHAAWLQCESLVHEFIARCLRNEHQKYRHLTREQILEQYCTRLQESGYGSSAQMRWVVRRCAAALGWPAPSNSSADS